MEVDAASLTSQSCLLPSSRSADFRAIVWMRSSRNRTPTALRNAALRDHVRESKPAWKLFVLERRLPSPRARHGTHRSMPRDIRLVLY